MTTMTWRKKSGLALIIAGLVVWLIGAAIYLGNVTGLFGTIPYAGFVTTGVGAFSEAIGISLYRGEPVLGTIEKRRTSLIIVIPAMLLFGGMLAGAVALFSANFEQTTTGERWVFSTVFLGVSLFIFSALLRDVLLRFGSSPATRGAQQ